MKEEFENKSNKELLDSVMENMGRYMNCQVEHHPHWSYVKEELEERLQSWKRSGPRKLKVKSI